MNQSEKETFIMQPRREKDSLENHVNHVKLILVKEKEENMDYFISSLTHLGKLIKEEPCSNKVYSSMEHNSNYLKCEILKEIIVLINTKTKEEQIAIYDEFVCLLNKTCPEYVDNDLAAMLYISAQVENAV